VSANQVERRLTAILAADVAGYSRLMGTNEEGTLETLNLYRGVMSQLIEEHQGRVISTTGDGLLAEFNSPVQAVRSAVAVQRALDRRNADLEHARHMKFRIGINVGDVMVQGGDLLGEGVNIAARLEQMAEPAGILVSGTVWEQIQDKLSFPCTYLGEQTVKNIARPVRAYRVTWDQPDADLSAALAAPKLPAKPSIAVLPFTNMGGDPEQEYFAAGICEDIITALSRSRWLFVIARNTSFVYRDRTTETKLIGRELGVRYILEGSVRRAGNRVRITAQLIDASTGAQLWSERYDRDLADVFALQDEITDSVVGAIEPELQRVEELRAARKTPESMDAWDHYMRGMWRFYQFSSEDTIQAELLMRQAIKIDPKLTLGHLGLARVLALKILWGWSENLDVDRQAAYAAGRLAVELDEKEAYGHYTLAWASLLTGRQEVALLEAQKSIDLTPNFALAYYILGAIRVFLGRFDQVSDPINRAIRLSPHEPQKFLFYNFLALAEYHQGHFEEAARIAQLGIAVRPFHMLYRTLAACCGQLGRTREARIAIAELRRLMPKDAEHQWEVTNPYINPLHRAQFIAGIRKAGMD
jgi:adenylate cyclase